MFASLIEGFRNWRERRSAMVELRRLNHEEAPFKHAQCEVLLEDLRNASFREDEAATMAAYHRLQTLAPDVAISSETAIRSLLAIGKTELAESVIEEGLGKYPDNYLLLLLHADLAGRRGDWDQADRRWKIVRRRFPDDYWACYWGAVALEKLEQPIAADKMLERAMKLDPLQPSALSEYARIAERRGDLQESLRRWERVRKLIEDQAGWVGYARILYKLDREDDAIQVLTQARCRFQSRAEPLIELAEICHRRGAGEEAALHWQALREEFPQLEQGYTSGARVLRELGRQEEAKAVLDRYAARRRSPSDPA